MKKNVINLIIAVLFTSVTAMASTTPSISTDGTKTFVVNTDAWKSQNMNIEIRDAKGTLIFEDNYKTNKNKKFNFENLPSGSYSIIMENELKSTTQKFEITSTEIILLPNEVTTYKPVINLGDDYIDLNYLSNSNTIAVNVYNNEGNIFTVEFNDKNSINQRFSTKELPKGSYTFSVASEGEVFTKRFKK